MPLENSCFIDRSLSSYLNSEYSMTARNITHLNKGSANIFEITLSNGESVIVKELKKGFPKDRIEQENSILQHLSREFKASNIAFPFYIRNKHNQVAGEYDDHRIIVQNYIPGRVLGAFEGNNRAVRDSAVVYASILNAMASLPFPLRRYQEGREAEEVIEQAIKTDKNLLETSLDTYAKQELTRKLEMLQSVQKWDLHALNQLTTANCHGDYTVFQMIFDENDNVRSVVDFLSAKSMPIVIELVRSYFYMDAKNSYSMLDVVGLCRYLKVFESNCDIKMNSYDKEYLLLPYLLRLLTSSFGYSNRTPALAEVSHKLFIQCELLMSNYSDYSKTIIKELL